MTAYCSTALPYLDGSRGHMCITYASTYRTIPRVTILVYVTAENRHNNKL